MLRRSTTEYRLNKRTEQWLEARHAAESLAEYGFSKLQYSFENNSVLDQSFLDPSGANGLELPSTSHFSSDVDTSSLSLTGGLIPNSSTLTVFDATAHNNAYDPLKGTVARIQEIPIYAKATVNDSTTGHTTTAYVTQTLQVRDVDLFSHAAFYNMDLEISPGPKMDIYGPVHTNGNLYVQSWGGLDFHDQVTTAKHMYYGWGTDDSNAQGSGGESLQTGDVKFIDGDGSQTSMKTDGSYMDSMMGSGSLSSEWRSYASNRWGGNLLTSDHGVQSTKSVAFDDYQSDDPTTDAYDPVNSGHALIEPALLMADSEYVEEVENQKIANLAGLRFVWDAMTNDISAYSANGTLLDIAALEEPDSDEDSEAFDSSDYLWKVKRNGMYDPRRDREIDILDINIGKLEQLIEDPGSDAADKIGDFNPITDWNGVVYVEVSSSSGTPSKAAQLNWSAVRIWGGSTVSGDSQQGIPSRGSEPGMSFGTNNAVYIRGDFNADGVHHNSSDEKHSAQMAEDGEVPVAIYGDSITILSNDWDDDYSIDQYDNGTWSKPSADPVEISAAIVTGLIPSDAADNGASSGGLHNFPRFIENWSGKDLYIRGSFVALYESEIDTSVWKIDYYRPPNRKWGFHEFFASGIYPPGSPILRTYRRINYETLSAAEYESAVSGIGWAE